jgi:hypothetical protein
MTDPAIFAPAAGEDVTMIRDKKDTVVDREALLRRLRELIEALDRRVPHLEREGEIRIAREAGALRQKAEDRIAELGVDVFARRLAVAESV